MKTDWNRHWELYGGLGWKFWFRQIRRGYRKLLEGIDLRGGRIAELGSGSGMNTLELTKVFKPAEILLVDSCPAAIRISKRVLKGFPVRFFQQDILKLRLKNRFDLVHSEGLIEHFFGKDRERAFRKHVQLCRKGGYVLVFVPIKSLRYRIFKLVYQKLGKWIWDEEPLTPEELRGLFRRNGLKILREYQSRFLCEYGILGRK